MRGAYFLSAIFVLLFTLQALAQKDLFLQANKAYNESDFKSAIAGYDQILSDGNVSPDLYLNLGNAYFKSGKLGKAILNYERGLRLDNNNQLLLQNLKYAKKQILIPITPIPDFFLSRYWSSFKKSLGSSGWAVLQIFMFFLLACALGLWLLSKELKVKKKAFYSMIVLTLGLLIAMVAGSQRYGDGQKASHAVVITNDSKLHSGASTDSEILQNLSEGVKLRLLDRIEDYYKVQLMDKEIGWISTQEVEAI